MKRFLSLAILAVGIAAAQTPAPVKVEGGLLQGTSEDGLTVYRGIPFAAPPVGELRWRAPQPAAKWEGVKQANKFGPRCYQGGRGAPGVDTSEDCLYLNVWSPAKSAERPHPGSGLDLRRRFQRRRDLRADLQRGETGQKRRCAGEHRLPRGTDGLLRAPGVKRGESAPRLRQLWPAGYDLGTRVGADGISRRSAAIPIA